MKSFPLSDDRTPAQYNTDFILFVSQKQKRSIIFLNIILFLFFNSAALTEAAVWQVHTHTVNLLY